MVIKRGETDGAKGSECCMCGDYGLSDQLFQCQVCIFRWQHRYCSNLYPKAESCGVCNWCLAGIHLPAPSPKPTQSSSSSTSATRQRVDGEGGQVGGGICRMDKNKTASIKRSGDQDPAGRVAGPGLTRRLPPSPRPPSTTRKRIITRRALEERLMMRRAKWEDIGADRNGRDMVIRKRCPSPTKLIHKCNV
ncbi:hypothetical protein SAY87_014080 [Trapa incisa]|uniref:PHD-type zinc finger plants domain-containing protein n=1 Tax=Trapa incisa TaxID=236973 RepID=A0AAN7GZL3_9MYRT|nr:hypothetical protein SAY87_014080 [Trapa incisa]